MSKQKPPFQPFIRVAPPGELNAFVVYEHQLDTLSQGSPSSLMLNFALFFLGVASTAIGTLISIPPDSDRAFYLFLIVGLVTGIAGVVLLALWWFTHTSIRHLIAKIKSQMPQNPEARPEAGNRAAQSSEPEPPTV